MMLKDIPQELWPEVLFNNLVLSLSNAAMMSMGKLAVPGTEKTEKDMDMAHMNIEMINMLADKTKNNLSDKENALITATLSNLKLMYAKEMESGSTE
jgi:Domain of unknown function (DUF1844)